MLQFTYDLGFLGFLIRIVPALFMLGLGASLHLAASRQLQKNATSVPFMVLFADAEELTERGDSARTWSLGFYASGAVTLGLIAFLGGVPTVTFTGNTPAPASKGVREFGDTAPRSLPPKAATVEDNYQGGDDGPGEE